MNILIENASKDNYLLAGLFAEPKEKPDDMNDTALFDEKVMDVLFEEPMEVVLDDEISISTAAVITHLKSEKASRTRSSARKLGAPPSSKKSVTVGRRRTRSMDKADVAQKLNFEREDPEPEPKPSVRKTRRLPKKTEEKDQTEIQTEEQKPEVNEEQPEVKITSTRKARRLPRKKVNEPEQESEEAHEEPEEVQEKAEVQKEIVKPIATKKKPTSKKNKMLERQRKIVDGVKKEVRKRIEDGEDPGPAPEVIMEPVSFFILT